MTSFLGTYWAPILVFVLTVITTIASEKWSDQNPKRFRSVFLFVFGTVLTISINSAFQTSNAMHQLDERINTHIEDTKAILRSHTMANYYEQINAKASGPLKKWGVAAEDDFDANLEEGYIPINREYAARRIAEAYSDAPSLASSINVEPNIIASNVGSIDFYFNVEKYKDENLWARDHHVPVIRFFIYSNNSNFHVKLTRNCDDKKLNAARIEDFSQCVTELNNELGSLCSVVINYDATAGIGEAQDILLMDNYFVAETRFYPQDWTPRFARATDAGVSQSAVATARKYFKDLWDTTNYKCNGKMSDDGVRSNFPQFKNLKPAPGQTLAEAASQKIMDDLARPVVVPQQ